MLPNLQSASHQEDVTWNYGQEKNLSIKNNQVKDE